MDITTAELAPVLLVEHVRVIELRPAPPTPGAPPVRGEQAGVGQLLGLLLALDVRTDHPLNATVQPQIERVRLDVGDTSRDRQPVAVGYPDEVVDIRRREGSVLAVEGDRVEAHLRRRLDGPKVLIGQGEDERFPSGSVGLQDGVFNHHGLLAGVRRACSTARLNDAASPPLRVCRPLMKHRPPTEGDHVAST